MGARVRNTVKDKKILYMRKLEGMIIRLREEIKKIKKENTVLKEENKSLHREIMRLK